MNGDKFLLDTNAVLYLLNGDETLADFLFEIHEPAGQFQGIGIRPGALNSFRLSAPF